MCVTVIRNSHERVGSVAVAHVAMVTTLTTAATPEQGKAKAKPSIHEEFRRLQPANYMHDMTT